MSDYKENEELNESTEDIVDEIVEEATEEAIGAFEAADSVGSVVEGVHDAADVSGTEDAMEPSVQYAVAESGLEDIPVKHSAAAIIAVVVAIILALAVVVTVMAFMVRRAPYNYLGYINVSGSTIEDIAEMQGATLEQFLEAYNLPADMPANTSESAAYYSIPTGIIAQMHGLDFESFKIVLEIPDTISGVSLRHKVIDMISDKFNVGTEITEDTPWGITEGELTLSAYIGDEDAIASFKEMYGLGDDITGDTQWKEIRSIVAKKDLEDKKSEGDEEVVYDAAEEESGDIEVVEDEAIDVEIVEDVPETEVVEEAPVAETAE